MSQKIINKISHQNIFIIPYVVLAIILSIVSFYIDMYIEALSYAIPISLLWIINSIYITNPQIAFVATIIAFVISFCSHALASVISLILIFPFHNSPLNFPYYLLAIITGILQILLCNNLFKLKRFRNGMPFLYRTHILNRSTFICLFFFGFMIYMSSNYEDLPYQTVALLLFISFLAFLIYWWQAQITKSYRRSLELRELESLRTEVAELNLLVQKLSDENEKLARITHRDNTLISTLKNSTVKYLVTDFKNPAEALAARDKLITNINALSAGRTSLPPDYNEKKAREFDTGIPLLDELLHHMDEEAIKNKITFSVHLGIELTHFVPANISESDLVHLVDDLLKNAFKSTLTCEKRAVQLQFYKLGKHFVVEVSDNGIPFEVKSLVNMGIEKITTYADGSGIGLMDIWRTKEKCRATYHIEEYATAIPFSKKISLTFDKKNRYSIRTWRKNEILQMSKRTDLHVYDYNE